MKLRPLGKTGLEVSEIGFGSWAIGGNSYGDVRDEESLEALSTAYERGVNFFDTADIYGFGHSEELLGRLLARCQRDKILIATKAGHDFYHDGVKKNFASTYLRYACEQSLKRLKIDYIDVYQLHNPTPEILRQGDAVKLLQDLKTEGKIRHIGISVHSEAEAQLALQDPRVEVLQVIFNFLDQRMAERIFPAAQKSGIGIIAREPLACGVLTEKYQAAHVFPKNDHRCGWSGEKKALDQRKIEKIRTVLITRRLSMARAAIEYVLEFEAVSTVIPGAKNKTQTLENLLATEDPRLRSQESSQLRDLYQREAIFKEGLD